MDFAKKHFEEMGHGVYEELDLTSLPDLYIAYSPYLSENSEIFHNDIRGRFDQGEPAVIDAMAEWATLSQQARDLLSQGKGQELGPLLNRNFDLRKSIYHLSQGNLDMIEAARSAGASAKFTGSGGAIVGIYEGEEMFERLVTNLTPLGIKVLKPIIAPQVT